MNNEQFRRLLFDNPNPNKSPNTTQKPSPIGSARSHSSPSDNHSNNDSTPRTGPGLTPGGAGAGAGTGMALGSRLRSSIPMTPRTVTRPDFARQLADYRREGQQQHPNKRFKSSAAPKGTKLPAGYLDRAARLREAEEAEAAAGGGKAEVEEKLREVEERFKKGLVDEEEVRRVRRELGVGGDLSSTHMVKGLDWDLLRRVKAGEDISASTSAEKEDEERKEEEEEEVDGAAEAEVLDVDEEFDKMLESKEGQVLPSAPKEKEKKKGSMAPPAAPAAPARKKTRDEILRELRASRAAAAAPAADTDDNSTATATTQELALGARFKKVGDSKVEKKRFIEQDENGRRREVLLITDAQGKTKRKTRWLDKPGATATTTGPTTANLPAPDKEAKPLGMEVPAEIAARNKAQDAEEDDDIFEGVGADYDPLGAGTDEESDTSESEEEGNVAAKPLHDSSEIPRQEPKAETTKPRNYFAATTTEKEGEPVERERVNPLTKDPVLLAALKRAAALRQASPGQEAKDGEEEVDQETLLRRKKFLEEARRREELDAMDLDYGFGGSRNEDYEDEEAVLLERGGTKRKRGPKKKKGDKDSAADVLSVLERRKKA
ncbi:hypothetical protein BJX61DRAFT_446301 [Aspergillus egyptiacus]|nr:hypothetical protein BJX61DRAFT_446301 [Aspergillus egyptiacus]